MNNFFQDVFNAIDLKRRGVLNLWYIILSVLSITGAYSQNCSEIEKFIASNGSNAQEYGYAVDIDGYRILVGSPRANGIRGAAYLYEWDGSNWIETIITASDGSSYDNFGISVALDGDRMVIGAYKTGTNVGSIYIYDWDGSAWLQTRIDPSDGINNDFFGRSVDVSGDRVISSAYYDDDNGSNSGSVYLYEWDGSSWNELKFGASDGTSGDQFGYDCAMHNDRFIVGAINGDGNQAGTGSVYVYEWDGSTWLETKILASDGLNGDLYGVSVNIYNDRLVSGAFGEDENGYNAGSVYIYDWDGSAWLETKILASDGQANDNYGISCHLNGDYLIVGSMRDDDNGNSSGSAYIYEDDGTDWNESKVLASDGVAEDMFGVSVAIESGFAIVGAYEDDDNGTDSGSAYLFECCTTMTFYKDSDGDGFGNPNIPLEACTAPQFYVADNTDCDDSDINNYPGNTEICDGQDNNCDGQVDEGCNLAPCDDYYLTINNITQDNSHAFYTIVSDALVDQNNSILFTAGSSIDLLQSFEVTVGTIFEAIIEPCDASGLFIESDIGKDKE